MNKKHCIIRIIPIFILAASCTRQEPEPVVIEPTQAEKHGIDYVYDPFAVPEVHISISADEWDSLLTAFDADKNTKQYIRCDVDYIKGDEVTEITNAGLRLRGAASRRRPEGSDGQKHNGKWRVFHFQVNFHKFVKDDDHKVHGAKKIMFRYFSGDPTFSREHYCYDLFRRVGVFAGANCEYCRLYIKIEGDSKETYFGIYNMVEPVDEDFVKVRKEEFGSAKGNLWKCRHHATLAMDGYFNNVGPDNEEGNEFVYELKTNTDHFLQAKEQLQGFITDFNRKEGREFHDWIKQVCDVELLLRTYAVNVAVGMWDDYWCNENNYYIYFNTTDPTYYQFFFIPYDYDHSLGDNASRSGNSDQARHDPFNWGSKTRPLIWKILQFNDYRMIYKEELKKLVDENNELLHWKASRERILAWQKRISRYIKNDLNPYAEFKDQAPGNSGYLLYTDSPQNFFQIKEESIHKYCW